MTKGKAKEVIFTFWEGQMPEYIKRCLDTWQTEFTLLNYRNVNQYTELPIDRLTWYTLPQIADIVRVHVLRDNGGWWLDADTIMLTDRLPDADILGDPLTRMNTIGYLHTEKHSAFFTEWARYQDDVMRNTGMMTYWGTFGNQFTDVYLKNHHEVKMLPIEEHWPEVYMIDGNKQRMQKYREFYFEKNFHLADIRKTDMLMLHNSWTPQDYNMSHKCTMTNFLKEISNCHRMSV
jgi:hypothetical protein